MARVTKLPDIKDSDDLHVAAAVLLSDVFNDRIEDRKAALGFKGMTVMLNNAAQKEKAIARTSGSSGRARASGGFFQLSE